MKRNVLLLTVALLIGATSCTEEVIVQEGNSSSETVELSFNAIGEEWESNASTRTLVREGNQTFWVANDRISLFVGAENNYPFITKDGGTIANFKGTVTQAEKMDTYAAAALYPYNSNAVYDESTHTFTTILYTRQYAEPDSYASGMNVAVGRSSDQIDAQDLIFANAASYLRVSIPDTYSGKAISSMRLQGNNNELIAGNIRTGIDSNTAAAAVVIEDDEASSIIYLDQINSGETCLPGKSYYFVLAPTNMTDGYTLTLVYEDGTTGILTGEATNFLRNHIYNFIVGDDAEPGDDECGVITTDGLFTVTNLDCLYEWADRVNKGESSLGCYLVADIDFDGDTREWPAIGTDEAPFTGMVVGNGKTISNFKHEVTGERYAGFIDVMGEGGSVENLTFDTPTVSSTYVGVVTDPDDDGYVGTIVARLNESEQFNYTSAAIKNCEVINPTLSGGENVGGIVGRSYGRNDAIQNSTVSGGTIAGHMFVGGIAGNSEGIIENCHVKNGTNISYHDTQSEARVGGIVGTNNSGQLVACTANATVDGDINELDARYCGGIAGANNGTMIGCAFTGTVLSNFGGALAGESYGDMYGCYAQNATANALIYKVKSNTNNEADVITPTFSACYWVGSSGTIFASGSLYDYKAENCGVVPAISQVTQTMNIALNTVNSDGNYAYGSGYQYTTNTGDDSYNFPVKATVEQQVQ